MKNLKNILKSKDRFLKRNAIRLYPERCAEILLEDDTLYQTILKNKKAGNYANNN